VKAGRDVYVIDVCDGYIDIGYIHCGDQALTVKKDNDFTYTVSTALCKQFYNLLNAFRT